MNLEKCYSFHKYRSFSASSASASSLPWISPLLFTKLTPPTPDPPPEISDIEPKSKRISKFISHGTAINLIKREKDPKRALQIFNMVSEQKGFNHNNATYGVILYKLAQCKKFEAVDAILHQMRYETCKFHEGIFINLMKRFSEFGLHAGVLKMFDLIQPIVREKPSLKAISTCLNLLIESNQVELARTFLLNAKKYLKLRPNTCIFNILVKHHCRNGDLESASQVVAEMKKSTVSYPNLVTYSTLMEGLCGSGRLKEAMELFEEMVAKDQISPDALTYNILINGFCRGGKVNQAKKIMEFAQNNGCEASLFNYSTLMNGFCKEGMLQEARDIFKEMKNLGLRLDTVGYTTLIDCFCKSGRTDGALELLREMKEKECKADVVTFNVILGGLCRERRFQEAIDMLENLPYQGVYLNKASYRIVLNLLSQSGELEKAKDVLGLMLDRKFWPHHATSNELLIQFCKAGKVDDAVTVLFGLAEVGFKPENECWALLVEWNCRERKLLPVFQLLDKLTGKANQGQQFQESINVSDLLETCLSTSQYLTQLSINYSAAIS